MKTFKIPEIVLTGGPCSGKTSALSFLRAKLAEHGFRVLTKPEVPTLFIANGLDDISQIAISNRNLFLEIEQQFLRAEYTLRQQFRAVAESCKEHDNNLRPVIISDRGPMDVAAYLPSATAFETLLSQAGFDLHSARDSYDAVFHLVTAAENAVNHYNLDNPARQESDLQLARDLDERIKQAWIGHEHLKIIDSRTNFDQKLEHLLACVLRSLGIPDYSEIERRFLIARPNFSDPMFANLLHWSSIQQVFIQGQADTKQRIRKKTTIGKKISGTTHYLTSKTNVAPRIRRECETFIREADYFCLEPYRIANSEIIRKVRFYFVYKNQYFILDEIRLPISLCLLEIELENPDDPIELPPFLQIEKEVTDDDRYTNFGIACGRLRT